MPFAALLGCGVNTSKESQVVGYFGLFDILSIAKKKRNATTANKTKNHG